MRRGRILIVVALILILCVVAAYFVTRGLGQGTGTADQTQQAPDVPFLPRKAWRLHQPLAEGDHGGLVRLNQGDQVPARNLIHCQDLLRK